MSKKIVYLVISILLNTLGNALMIKVALGSAPWAAAALNTSGFFGITTGQALIALGVFALIMTNVLRKRLELIKDAFNFVYMLFYGYFVDIWLFVLGPLRIDIYVLRLIVCVFGIALIGCAISVYFRVNLVIHPFDDFIKILKTDYMNGSVVRAQWITLGIALGISVVFGLLNGRILGVNIGTILTYILLGQFAALCDKVRIIKFDNEQAEKTDAPVEIKDEQIPSQP